MSLLHQVGVVPPVVVAWCGGTTIAVLLLDLSAQSLGRDGQAMPGFGFQFLGSLVVQCKLHEAPTRKVRPRTRYELVWLRVGVAEQRLDVIERGGRAKALPDLDRGDEARAHFLERVAVVPERLAAALAVHQDALGVLVQKCPGALGGFFAALGKSIVVFRVHARS